MKNTFDSLRLFTVIAAIAGLGLSAATGARAADAAQLAEQCADCHGENGVSKEPSVPTIAGMSAYFLTDTMAIYKERGRPCVEAEYLAGASKGSKTDMCKIADELSDEDAEALAEYYAGKAFVPASQEFDSGKVALGQEVHDAACKKCHEAGGAVAEDDAGFLAGQWMPYLRQVFEHYAAGDRPMPKKMQPKFDDLSADDREAFLHYYASLQ